MKSLLFFLFSAFLTTYTSIAQQGFTSVVNLSSIPVSDKTADKPQAKVWTYANKWWCVLASSGATKIFRLDGTTWTPVLTLATTNSKPDCRVVGNVVHFLLYKGASSNSLIVSAEYDPASDTYKLWSQRPSSVTLRFPTGSKTATLVLDANGRMWVASDGVSDINVWWSDAPYTNWSTPINVATGVTDDDICAIAAFPNQSKIGIFWSNKNTKRFGFKTHLDGSDPADWSADEIPSSQSAIDNIGAGMADNHMNIKVASDGTLYCAARTSYSKADYPQVILLVRRPNGNWDDLYPVTMNPEGTQAILLLNEALGKIKVAYTTDTNGDILYRESSISNISFGPSIPLISGGGNLYNNATSTHQSYNSEIVILSTNISTSPWQAAGVLATDGTATDNTPPAVQSINRKEPLTETTSATSVTFGVSFSEPVSGVGISDFALTTTGATVANIASVSGSGSTYDITVNNITGEGTLRLDLNSSGTGIADAAGNAISSGFTSGQTYNIQQGVPTLSSVHIASSNSTPTLAKAGDVIELSFTASEPINTPVVTIATHAVALVAGSGNSFTATYTMTSTDNEGLVSFSIDFSNTNGTAGTQVTATTDGSRVDFDNTPPAVQSINRKEPLTETTSATSVTFGVSFSEPVSGVGISDFALTTTGATVANIASVSGSGSTYDITVNNITGEGTLRLDLNSSGTGIADAAGNAISSGFTSGQTYSIQQIATPPTLNGFASITKLNPIPIKISTAHKPQHKAWKYAGKWWSVLSTSSGAQIFRLDGTSWTAVLKIASTTSARADCRVVGNVVHIILFRGSSDNSYISSIEYDAVAGTYKLWSQRKSIVTLPMPSGAEAATLEIDGAGRMWVAYAGVSEVYVRWSDAPYSTWSAPVTIATGVKDDDICAITRLPGKIGVLWSNQNTKRFGFKTHSDDSSPTSWSADEMPAAQSAIDNVGLGMADDHINIVVASDGTLYCAAKTSYNTIGYPQIILLVRRPDGSWDDLYQVTPGKEGSQAIVVLNETQGKIKVVYTTIENGGDILYRESFTSTISFGVERTLISGGGYLYNYATSTHQTYDPEVVILATNISTSPLQAVGVLASDNTAIATTALSVKKTDAGTMNEQSQKEESLQLYPNPFASVATLSFSLAKAGNYTITLYDGKGIIVSILKQGWSEAGFQNTVSIDGSFLTSGFYLVSLQTGKESRVLKLLKK